MTGFAELEAAGPLGIVERDDDDLAALMYTGGTTGRAKGVMLTHRDLWTISKSATTRRRTPASTGPSCRCRSPTPTG